MSFHAMSICQLVGLSNPEIRFNNVDLPDHEGHIIAIKSPFSILSDVSFSIETSHSVVSNDFAI
jgi:hypothetical protein